MKLFKTKTDKLVKLIKGLKEEEVDAFEQDYVSQQTEVENSISKRLNKLASIISGGTYE